MTAGITQIQIENYKSIRYCDVRLEPLTFLVGPNGSGKSNFLDALKFLGDFAANPNCIRELPEDCFYRSNDKVWPDFRIKVELMTAREEQASGEIRVNAGNREKAEHWHHWHSDYDWCGESFHSAPVEFGSVEEIFNRLVTLTPTVSAIRPVPVADVGWTIGNDGSNVANVFARLDREFPSLSTRVVEYLKAIVPDLDAVRVQTVSNYQLLSFVMRNGAEFNSLSVSDGTLRAFAILVALFDEPDGPLLIEEPENCIHPGAAEVLFDAMNEASQTKQVIASTHSAELLDRKEVKDASILAVEMRDGATHVEPISEGTREILRKRLFTVGELMRMGQLFTEPNLSLREN